MNSTPKESNPVKLKLERLKPWLFHHGVLLMRTPMGIAVIPAGRTPAVGPGLKTGVAGKSLRIVGRKPHPLGHWVS